MRLNVISNLEEGNTVSVTGSGRSCFDLTRERVSPPLIVRWRARATQVIGIELLSQSLLPAIVHLAEDRQWRVRLAIIEYIPLLAAQLGQDYFEERLSDMCMSWLADNVYSIRGRNGGLLQFVGLRLLTSCYVRQLWSSAEAATINLRKLTESFGVEWARTNIIPRILAMHSNANYLHRLTSLHAVRVLCEAMNAETIQTLMIPLAVELAQVMTEYPLLALCSDESCTLTLDAPAILVSLR